MKKLLFLVLITNYSLLIVNAQWVQVSNGWGAVYSVACSGNTIFAGAYLGLYLSTDNGSNWTQALGESTHSLAVSGNNVFAGCFNYSGVYKSTDNGSNWTQTSLNNRTVLSLAVSGNNVFAGTVDYFSSYNGVYVSNDNGANWTQTSLDSQNVYSLAVNGNNVFAGMGYPSNGLYLSTDNGITWTQTSLNNRAVNALAVNGNIIFAGTSTYGVYLSTNNGTNWTQTSLNYRTVNGLLVNGNNVFAGTFQNGVYVSNNNGTSWTQRNEGLGNLPTQAFCLLNNYIFAGTNGVYRRPLGELIGIRPISEQVPTHYALEQNYPNPFNPATKINFSLPKKSFVKIIIYDALGRAIAELVNQHINPGTYSVDWDASNFPSGIYFYSLLTGDYKETRKMVLMK